MLVLNGGDDDREAAAATLAGLIPGAIAAVVGEANHGMACRDSDFQSALVGFVTANR